MSGNVESSPVGRAKGAAGLPSYAAFLRQGHDVDLTAAYLRAAVELGAPLATRARQFAEDELRAIALAAVRSYLDAMVEERALEHFRARLQRWEEDRLQYFSREQVDPTDLVLVDAALRRALLELLPRYTSDGALVLAVVNDLERLFVAIQTDTMRTFARQRAQAASEITRLASENEKEKAFLESIVAHAPAGIAALSPDLVFEWVNPSYQQQTGVPQENLVGRRFFEVFAGTEEQVAQYFEPVGRGEQVTVASCPFSYRIDGEMRESYWDASIVPMKGTSGAVEKILLMVNEVSERVGSERLQRERIEDLMRMDALKDEFLSVLSHELRTPLNCILGFTSLLGASSLEPVQAEYLDEIGINAHRMKQLVEDLLDMAKIRAGKLDLVPTWTDIAALVDSTVAALQPLLLEKDLSVEVQVDVAEPIFADRKRLMQVLMNLLSNAIKFSRRNGRVTILARLEADRLVTEVVDEGVGFRPEDTERLFIAFQQLNGGSKREAAGTGLGLSIVKGLLEGHGGGIEAESPGPGCGSTFRFWLPRRAASTQAGRVSPLAR